MKKLFPAVVIAVFAVIMFASCNKDYTCTCTVTSVGVSHVISSDIGKTTKSDAQNKCNAMRTYYTDTVSAVTASCHL
ncbi:MAG: hypothetical protein ACHQII_05290 [Bacteroidia bacterium]